MGAGFFERRIAPAAVAVGTGIHDFFNPDDQAAREQRQLDYLTANAPGAAPDAFSSVVSSAAKSKLTKIGMGRAQTFLTGLPGLDGLSQSPGVASSVSSPAPTERERRPLQQNRYSSRSLLGDLL